MPIGWCGVDGGNEVERVTGIVVIFFCIVELMDRCIRVVMLSFYHGHQRDVRDSACLKGTDSPDVLMFFCVFVSLSPSLCPCLRGGFLQLFVNRDL